MSTKIPSSIEVKMWYEEVLKIPSFLETLNPYQKSKLIEFCQIEIKNTVKTAFNIFENYPEKNYPKELPIDQQFNYLMNTIFKHSTSKPIYILNLLGFTWTPEEDYKRIEQTKNKNPENKDTENKIDYKHRNKNWEKFSQAQIALYLIYKNIKNIHDPRSLPQSKLHTIAEDFGWIEDSSAYLIFKQWSKRKDNQTQRLGHKKPQNVIKDIKEIILLLSSKEMKQVLEDLDYLKEKIN